MHAESRFVDDKAPLHRQSMRMRTTLYDLLEAIQEEVPRGQRGDRLATEVMVHLLDSGRIRFLGNNNRSNAA